MRSNLSGNSRLPSPQSQQDPKEYVDSNADLPDSIWKAMESEDESEAWIEAIRNEADYLDKHVWIPETSASPKRPLNTKLVLKRKFKSGKRKYKVRIDAYVYDKKEALPQGMKIPRHIDVIKAYINAEIDEDTYVKASSNPDCVTFSPGAILRYLQQTKHLKQNHTDDHLSNIRLHAYSDSDFTACSNTARSIAGYLIYKGPAPLKRNSKRQSILAQNSANAEDVDNQAASMIAIDPSSLQKLRQFRVIYHRLQMAVERYDLNIRKISSHENHADIGTKELVGPDHDRHPLDLELQFSDFDDNTCVRPWKFRGISMLSKLI